VIPEPYKYIINRNYKIIESKGITDNSLKRYFNDCFDDIGKMVGLWKTWICVKCLDRGPDKLELDRNYGWGDNPKKCKVCRKNTYEVATFQARAPYAGSMFEYACFHLITKKFGVKATLSSEQTKLYDFEIKNNVVIEAKGSPESIRNPDGNRSKLGRAGLLRTDTKKKAFANAAEWHKRFPQGHFFIISNAIPNDLRAWRDDKIYAIYDVTNANQLNKLIDEIAL
jgi:hypothetical protein